MMEIVSIQELQEWGRLDTGVDESTIGMLLASATEVIEHHCGRRFRPYTDTSTGQTITPLVPQSIKHAVAVLFAAHFDDRTGSHEDAWKTVKALCAPWWTPHL